MIEKQMRMIILIQEKAVELRAVHDTKEYDNCKITEFHNIYEIKRDLSDSEIDKLFSLIKNTVVAWLCATNTVTEVIVG